MRQPQASGLPALFLALVMGVAVLLPEAGHSLAHRQGGVHGSHDVVGHIEADHPSGAAASTGHAAGDHPHLDLLATPPGKPLLAYAVAEQTILRLLNDFQNVSQLPAGASDTVAPVQSNHGPPPPTRAPPRI